MTSDPRSIAVSIVIICKNNPEDLRKTLASLHGRLTGEVEVVIVDGSDSQSCQTVSMELGFGPSHIVELDEGIYQAMNKGIARSSGTSILFLNSGDRLHAGFSFQRFIDRYRATLVSNVIIGRALYCVKGRKFENTERELPVQQAMFFPTSTCRNHGFDTRLAICADSLFLALALDECGHMMSEDIVCEFELGGLSTAPRSLSHVRLLCREMRMIGEINSWLGERYWNLRLFLKMILIRTIGLENQFMLFARVSGRWREFSH